MSPTVACLLIGLPAGFLNVTTGAGNLLSFLMLTALGTPPLVAHASNQAATPASFALALRKKRGHEATWLMKLTACAGITLGVWIFATTPAHVFADFAPVGMLVAAAFLLAQARRPHRAPRRQPVWLTGCGVYGGLVGPGVSTLLLFTLDPTRPPSTWVATKNALALWMSGWQAVVVFGAASLLTPGLVNWTLVGALAAGMFLGGVAGTAVVDRLPNSDVVRGRIRTAVVAVSFLGAGWMLMPTTPPLGVLVASLAPATGIVFVVTHRRQRRRAIVPAPLVAGPGSVHSPA